MGVRGGPVGVLGAALRAGTAAAPLTVREAALVHTFPAGWDWCDVRLADGWAMVANAVPPVLARHLGAVLRGVL